MDEKNKNIYEILLGREKRANTQKKLLEIFKTPLVSFTLNIPGAEKIGPLFYKVFKTGVSCFEEKLFENNIKIINTKEGQSAAGYEAFFSIDEDAGNLKKFAVSIEEEHALGRLFDFDVFDAQGNHLKRVELGLPERKCIICGERAVVCSRSRKHSVDELLAKIESMIDEFYK